MLYYKKPTEIVQLVMSSADICERMQWEWEYNNGDISEPWQTDHWLDLTALFWPFVVKGNDMHRGGGVS